MTAIFIVGLVLGSAIYAFARTRSTASIGLEMALSAAGFLALVHWLESLSV